MILFLLDEKCIGKNSTTQLHKGALNHPALINNDRAAVKTGCNNKEDDYDGGLGVGSASLHQIAGRDRIMFERRANISANRDTKSVIMRGIARSSLEPRRLPFQEFKGILP